MPTTVHMISRGCGIRTWTFEAFCGTLGPPSLLKNANSQRLAYDTAASRQAGILGQRRSLYASAALQKKKAKDRGYESPPQSVHVHNPRNSQGAAAGGPFDFSDLEKSIVEAQERLRVLLRQVAPGRQLKQENVEAVQVKLKGGAESVRLSDIAQVVPKGGRTIAILVGQQESIKPITTSVLKELEVNPVPMTHDPLELHIAVPTATQETRKMAQQQIAAAGDRALQAVRQARAAQQKRLRTMELSKEFRPDDLHKAGKKMEELVEKGNTEVRRTTETARKAVDA